ncbi:Flp pilus assembly protein CpaB [Lentibacter sp. XHP0401]|jgi:pilus assembly protein CpaB|uniref:Flp pilus assembly protein CpaB n=1 Tax=Lentibacter sp. XHP0401 TaxID=2984334 RepID=UPI0021E759D2|nr:Flp pilus assembly protein CpaB [Lentibacter sp. XHP0401]MCV2893051.1 Flp pilus assembly protein CpaB [Lentibacter sp. XHP0401]
MRGVFGLVLLVGIGLAGFAVYMAKDYIEGYQNALAAERSKGGSIDTVEIFVSKKSVKYGDQLTAKDVRLVSWPTKSVPDGAFLKPEVLFPQGFDQPRSVLRSIEPGEAILAVKLTEAGEAAGLTSLLKPGQRAFTIEVNVSSGVSGFLRPGHQVDVYWTGRVATQNRTAEVTKLIESSLPLIAIDQSANEEVLKSGIARTVTVAASAQRVAALAQAQSTGRLSLSLVGSGDAPTEEIIEVDQNALLGLAAAQAPVVQQQEQVCTTRVRRGAEVVEMQIPCTN